MLLLRGNAWSGVANANRCILVANEDEWVMLGLALQTPTVASSLQTRTSGGEDNIPTSPKKEN